MSNKDKENEKRKNWLEDTINSFIYNCLFNTVDTALDEILKEWEKK